MSALVNALIEGRRERLLLCFLWCALFSSLLGIGYGFIVWQVSSYIRHDQEAELSRIAQIRQNAVSALQRLQREATAPRCSRLFFAQLQTVAFLPDGLNEFLYAPHGIVKCSTSHSKFDIPVSLGEPDIKGNGPVDLDLWLYRDLEPIGLPGATGNFAKLGSFAVAIPPYSGYRNGANWLEKEIVAVGPKGQLWYVAGEPEVYRRVTQPAHVNLIGRLTTVSSWRCGGHRLHCVASEARLLVWAREWGTILSSIAILAALFAWICSINIVSWFNRYWSFEARFCRYLCPHSVVIAYQPVVDLKSGKVSGCEVLARWRDIDGTIVAPDRFINIVERTGHTLAFTQMVADKAHEELRGHLPDDLPLQINFNVFASDFDSETLLRIFSKFAGRDSHLTVAVELIENDQIDFEKAQLSVEELGRAGIKTYIDDFGTGYSSIERVARLAVHGVKLDRSFAMSPPDSVLGRMLLPVIDMIKTSGHLIVVEGVETDARLNLLRTTGVVDYIQGYAVSRPVGIDEFIAFLGTCGKSGGDKQLAA